MSTLPEGGLRVRHSEYLGNLTTAAPTTMAAPLWLSWPINPGYGALFPWLSSVAAGFEKYRVRSMSFRYQPSCATTSVGMIVCCPEFDVVDPRPTTAQLAMASLNAFSTQLFAPGSFAVTGFERSKSYFIRSNRLVDRENAHDYDIMRLDVGVVAAAAQVCGDVYVSYDIDLLSPQMHEDLTGIVGVRASQPQLTGPTGVADVGAIFPGFIQQVAYNGGTDVQLRAKNYLVDGGLVPTTAVDTGTYAANCNITDCGQYDVTTTKHFWLIEPIDDAKPIWVHLPATANVKTSSWWDVAEIVTPWLLDLVQAVVLNN